MLQLKNIVKTYKIGDMRHEALKGLDISFRESEFVCILGQSGSGKTTLLNLIGGLDRYDNGDIVINGVSTKSFNDGDWDYYRNNSVGFVFQSYNLIAHQSVLSNVEIALTLAGESKKGRKEKAVEVLKKVGLGEHLNKKPNQLSGGQMQRVAIARALINNPDILLADEPTGALDSETSIQVMELLKEISKTKLVIMVTHNPELAQKYATRTVNLLDGEIISDTNPYTADTQFEKSRHKKISMSYFTALSLSFNNLLTKKGRTLLTAFAGSIGIIGIALVLALSSGLNEYIDSVQKDTMSSYPVSITSESVDLNTMLSNRQEMIDGMKNPDESSSNILNGIKVDFSEEQNNTILNSSLKKNNLTEFKKYLESDNNGMKEYVGENGIVYSYDLNFTVFTYNQSGDFLNCTSPADDSENSNGLLSSLGIAEKIKSFTSLTGGASDTDIQNFYELTNCSSDGTPDTVLQENYELLYGRYPENYDETVLVLNSDGALSAKMLCELGFLTAEEYEQYTSSQNQNIELTLNFGNITSHEFYLLSASDRYVSQSNDTFKYLSDDEISEKLNETDYVTLKISGIIKPKPSDQPANNNGLSLSAGVAYSPLLKEYIVKHSQESDVVIAQKSDPNKNILTGLDFTLPNDEKKAEEAKEYLLGLDDTEKTSVYIFIKYSETGNSSSDDTMTDGTENGTADTMTTAEKAKAFDEWLQNADDDVLLGLFDSMSQYMSSDIASVNGSSTSITDGLSSSLLGTLTDLIDTVTDTVFDTVSSLLKGLFNIGSDSSSIMGSLSDEMKLSLIKEYAASMDDEQKAALYTMIAAGGTNGSSDIFSLMTSLSGGLTSLGDSSAALLDSWVENTTDTQMLVKIYDEYIGVSSYEENMKNFGFVDYDTPTAINIYTDSFEDKEKIVEYIDIYNSTVEDDLKITYTDYASIITSSITTIINTVSYAIIAFVAVSLVVSCVMIGIITHISVMERTKEIGILRALGASKHNISQVFNAETFIIGCCSGLIGVGFSLVALVPINAVIERFTGIVGLKAQLPLTSSIILITISIVITLIGGLIPSKKAAKKDPVLALRSE